ncbi:MAG: ABC transporter substrate-binding protein, partial [Bacteroidaceae bacterium]|nr:ABC transporter substrate-binding protein [Bacteroidaceae bacterium]
VFEQAQDADYWQIKHHSEAQMTYKSLAEEYAPYTRFKAFEQKQIYDCNTRYYRYYEETPFHPERLLQDLSAIFHPQLFEGYTPYYFHPIAL